MVLGTYTYRICQYALNLLKSPPQLLRYTWPLLALAQARVSTMTCVGFLQCKKLAAEKILGENI